VNITVQSSDDQLQIRIKNDIAAGTRTAEANQEVARIKKLIADGGYRSAMRSEGGTGLSKLRKIIGQGPDRNLDFDFDGDDGFYVQIGMPTKEVCL
jgi:hypothetical protein